MLALNRYEKTLLLLLALLLAGCDRGTSQAVPGSGPEIHLAATTKVVKTTAVSDTAVSISRHTDAAKKAYSSANGGRQNT